MTVLRHARCLLTVPLLACSMGAVTNDHPPQPLDPEYTAKIREFTTEPFFLTEFVDHLPRSSSVPTPQKALGYIIGTPEKLTYTKDINAYFRTLASASPRVKVLTIGKSEEGREMLLAAISSEENLEKIDRYKADHREARRPPQIHRHRDRHPRPRGEALLLAGRLDPLAGNRLARDAHGAGLPPGRRRIHAHPGHPQERRRSDHTRRRSRRPRPHGRPLSLPQGQPRQANPVARLLGQVRRP